MITHSGHGSVMSALAHGVPLVCVPFARDQRDVALRAVATGAAVRLRPSRLTARKLSRAIEGVLERPGYREAARRMQAGLTTEDGAGQAAGEITEMALKTSIYARAGDA
jgi:UDP:flavonoid glycosyltransferase YjiC (YdhE family)